MASEGSVTYWVKQLQAGDRAAAQQLWERYFQRLVGLARKKLQDDARRAADEEDVALSAFASFCRGVARGHFPQLADRDDLWHLLVTVTVRKAIHLRRDERRQKRGGGAVQDEAALRRAGTDQGQGRFDELVGTEPTPEFAAQVAEEFRRLLENLGEDELRSIALWKLEGYTNAEIASKLGCVRLTVQRRLRLIRDIWAKEMRP
jgi:RNA polymerase sigma factor (sigma-70 family)